MSEPRRHHIVGQFYLKHFTAAGTKDGRLYVLDVPRQLARRSTPASEAVIKDFNLDEGLADPLGVEKFFADIEGKLAPALDKTVERGELLADARGWFVVFAALTIARLPMFRLHWQDYRHTGAGRGKLLPRDLPIAIEQVAFLLYDRWWKVKKFPVSAGTLATSDCPAILAARSELLLFTPDNFQSKDGIIALPLSSHCLVFSGIRGPARLKDVELDTRAAAMANGWQTEAAFSRAQATDFPPMLFSSSPDFPIVDRDGNLTTFRNLYPEFRDKIPS